MDYYIAAASDLPVPDGMSETIIPAGVWAVFECVGPLPQAMQSLQKRINEAARIAFPSKSFSFMSGRRPSRQAVLWSSGEVDMIN